MKRTILIFTTFILLLSCSLSVMAQSGGVIRKGRGSTETPTDTPVPTEAPTKKPGGIFKDNKKTATPTPEIVIPTETPAEEPTAEPTAKPGGMFKRNGRQQATDTPVPTDTATPTTPPTATPTPTATPEPTAKPGGMFKRNGGQQATAIPEETEEPLIRFNPDPTEEPEDGPVIRFDPVPTEEPEDEPVIRIQQPTAVPTATALPTATEIPLPTATPIPTATPLPTATPDPFIGIEAERGITYHWYSLGNDFKFMIVYQPTMTKAQSGQTAEGMFILFRAQIQNLTNRTITGLKYESFSLTNERTGETYPLSGFFSTITSTLWSLGLFRDQIQAGGQLDTYLVFDVQGNAGDPWVLNFVPTERLSNEMFTPIRISLPKVAQQ